MFNLFNNNKNIRTRKYIRMRKIIPYRTILITNFSLAGKINILL